VFSQFHEHLAPFIVAYGPWLVAVVIGLESIGLPLPGETTLVAAAIYAGTTQRLSIGLVIVAGILGAVIGDNIGYWIGRKAGFPLLSRYGQRVGISLARLRLGRYLFERHGGKVVFFGRFVALLRALAGPLAGALQMDWYRFLAFNVAAGVVWVGGYGFAAYLLGSQIKHLLGPIGLGLFAAAVVGGLVGYRQLRRHEAALQRDADARFGVTTEPG